MTKQLARMVATVVVVAVCSAITPSRADDEVTVRPRATMEFGFVAPAGAVFSRPGDKAIHKLIIRQIKNAPSGAYIRGVNWTFTNQPIADALLAANRDGVVVRVLVSRRSRADNAVDDLQTALGNDCGSGRSCIKIIDYSARGTNRFDGGLTTLHQKSWQFSTTGTSKRVTVITSHNATNEARDYQFNAGYQFVGNDQVYNTVRDMFVEQSKDTSEANPFREVKISGSVTLYFNPWNSPDMTDPVVDRIQGLPNKNLVVRIANSAWTDSRGIGIARALAAKARSGAKVFVLASEPLGTRVRDVLTNAGIPIHNGHFSDERYHHLKFMTAKWGSGKNTKFRVWTGSENWSNAARGSDELVVQVGAGSTYVDYADYFNSIY